MSPMKVTCSSAVAVLARLRERKYSNTHDSTSGINAKARIMKNDTFMFRPNFGRHEEFIEISILRLLTNVKSVARVELGFDQDNARFPAR